MASTSSSSQTLIFLITNVDNAIIGRYVGDAALGFYQFAYNTSNQPATQITGVLTQVMFPVFSKMADGDLAQARIMRARYYLTTVRYVTWLTTPIAVATILFAPALIRGCTARYGRRRLCRCNSWPSTASSAPSQPTWAASSGRSASRNG